MIQKGVSQKGLGDPHPSKLFTSILKTQNRPLGYTYLFPGFLPPIHGSSKDEGMKTYIVYVDGNELPRSQWIKAGSHNTAEKKAQAKYPGKQVSVAYTEV